MNLFVSLLLSVLSGHLSGVVKSDGLIAINSRSSVRKLYKQIGNGDAPSPESDPAFTDASLRLHICDEITGSEYFTKKNLCPTDMDPDKLSINLRGNYEIFERIYTKIPEQRNDSSSRFNVLPSFFSSSDSKQQKPTFEYQNLFTPEEFLVPDFDGKKIKRWEHVFVCLLQECHLGGEIYPYGGEIYPYYVSKEYNVVGDPFRAGRFIFTERGSKPSAYLFTEVLLAEEPAKVFEDKENSKYNVELEYLERRQELPLAPDDASDPICSLLSQYEPDNEQDRLCAMVMTSSDFQGTTIEYPESWYLEKCAEITVSFRSEEAQKIVGEKVYRERALRCHCRNSAHNNSYDYFYITRGYAPNEVFLLERDSSMFARKTYLKNLTIDVGIVRGGVTVDRSIPSQ